jgi:hypothetical protein
VADEDTGALGNPLRVEDDEYELADEPELVAVARRDALDDARDTARELVEHGLGATVAPVGAAFEVRVLPAEAARAGELLGDGPPTPPDGPVDGPPAKPPVPWRVLILIWVAAMVAIPLAAFLATYLIAR